MINDSASTQIPHPLNLVYELYDTGILPHTWRD